MKKVIGLLLLSFLFVGCSATKEYTDTAEVVEVSEETVVIENEESEVAEVPYTLSTKEYVDEEKGVNIRYLQMDGLIGELTQDYINQSLSTVIADYSDTGYFKSVKIAPTVWMTGEDILSISYEGTAVTEGGKEVEILVPVNIDIASSNEIDYNNFINDDLAVREIIGQQVIEQGLATAFEAEGIRMYMNKDEVFFAYMPLDDTAGSFIRVGVAKELIEEYMNTDFGEHPAS